MRTAEERIKRINWLLDKRLERVEQGTTYWTSLPEFRKLKASSKRWGPVELKHTINLEKARQMPIMRAVNWFCQFMDDLDVRIQASKKRRMEEEAEELRLYTLKAYEEAKKYQA